MAKTKGSTKDYTLATFAETLGASKGWMRDYRAQCTWNDRTAKLLANTTPWEQRHTP